MFVSISFVTKMPHAWYLLPTRQFAFVTTTSSETVWRIALPAPRLIRQSRQHPSNNHEFALLIQIVSNRTILFAAMVCASAKQVFTRAMEVAIASTRTNVLTGIPIIATSMLFAQTQKGVTRVPAEMDIKT
jgi:hypothetical protein